MEPVAFVYDSANFERLTKMQPVARLYAYAYNLRKGK